jgi:hypothetical protein
LNVIDAKSNRPPGEGDLKSCTCLELMQSGRIGRRIVTAQPTHRVRSAASIATFGRSFARPTAPFERSS